MHDPGRQCSGNTIPAGIEGWGEAVAATWERCSSSPQRLGLIAGHSGGQPWSDRHVSVPAWGHCPIGWGAAGEQETNMIRPNAVGWWWWEGFRGVLAKS